MYVCVYSHLYTYTYRYIFIYTHTYTYVYNMWFSGPRKHLPSRHPGYCSFTYTRIHNIYCIHTNIHYMTYIYVYMYTYISIHI